MNGPLPDNWIDLYLDGELSPEERSCADQILSEDARARKQLSDLRQLNEQLASALPCPVLDVPRLMASLDCEAVPLVRGGDAAYRNGRAAWLGILITVMVLVVAVLLVQTPELKSEGIATLNLSTGSVELLSPRQREWKPVASPHHLKLQAGTRLRTREQSLCEVTTQSQGTVRINEKSEIALTSADELELCSGQFWCRASPEKPILIRVALKSDSQPAESLPLQVFTCPANSTTVWQAEDQTARCISVTDQATEIRSSGQQAWTIEAGSVLACSPGETPQVNTYFDRLLAVSWQLPLLNQRAPQDPELQGMLQRLLVSIGQSKMGGLYDEEIRQLGPAGTIPLIAMVRSPQSQADPPVRQRAMQIVADLAPESARADLEVLLSDQDPVIARLAGVALERWSESGRTP